MALLRYITIFRSGILRFKSFRYWISKFSRGSMPPDPPRGAAPLRGLPSMLWACAPTRKIPGYATVYEGLPLVTLFSLWTPRSLSWAPDPPTPGNLMNQGGCKRSTRTQYNLVSLMSAADFNSNFRPSTLQCSHFSSKTEFQQSSSALLFRT